MVNNRFFLFSIAGLLCISCARKQAAVIIQSEDTEPLTTEGAQVLKIVPGNDTIRFSSLIKSMDIIPLETTPESMISEIRTIKYDAGTYFIFDYMGKKILTFDSNGAFKTNIGNRGRGHGEYFAPALMGIDPINRNVLVIDNTKTMLRYGYDGQYLSSTEFSISASDLEVTDNSYIFYTSNCVNFKPGYEDYWGAELTIIDRNNTDSIRRYIPVNKELYPIGEGHTTIPERTPFTPLSDSYIFHYNFTDYIYSIDCKSGQVRVKYIVDYGKKAFKDDLASMEAMEAIQYIGSNPDRMGWTSAVVETDALLFFSYVSNLCAHMYFNDKESGKTLCGPFVPDITEDCKVLGFFDDRTMFAVMRNKSRLKEDIFNKNIVINGLERLDALTDEDNPIILIFHF